jgi:glutamate-1-semialdehyde 2,1-aminomutase
MVDGGLRILQRGTIRKIVPRVERITFSGRFARSRGQAVLYVTERAGFRLDLRGSWELVGVKPDLSAWSKAIANGRALAAVTGSEWLRKAASGVFVTGSFWCGAVPMAAAIATLNVLTRDDVVGHISRLGLRLRDGLALRAGRHGLKIRQTGPAQMPMVLFDDDADFKKGNAFCRAALRRGVRRRGRPLPRTRSQRCA